MAAHFEYKNGLHLINFQFVSENLNEKYNKWEVMQSINIYHTLDYEIVVSKVLKLYRPFFKENHL